MKKKVGIILSAGIIAIVLGVGIFKSDASQQTPSLTMEEIKQLVQAQYPGKITELELEHSYKGAVYEVEVVSGDKEYDIVLDGNSGEVLSLKEKMLLNQDKEESVVNKAESEKVKEEAKKESDTPKVSIKEKNENNKTEKKSSKTEKNTAIDMKSAIEIAKAEFPGVVVEADLTKDDGRLKYEIEIYNGKEEAEVELDALTGEIVILNIDNDDYDYLNGRLDDVIDVNSAINIAQKQFSGKVVSIDLDEDDDRLIYEIEIEHGNQEAEIDIDAISGKVLEVDIDD